MHALIVFAHPDPQSLTHAVATRVGEGARAAGHSVELADLAAEGFDPRYGQADHDAYRELAPHPADVRAEQARIERADALVLVYPVYWWSMPALLKGWVDRVFSNNWAYATRDGRVVGQLQRLNVHLLALGGADQPSYIKHAYDVAMKTQIDHGVFDYCAACVASSTIRFDTQEPDGQAHLQAAFELGGGLFGKEAGCRAA
ncbi:NAD(P)H-dependent oxidoreductase [Lysobacter enzymogenes]|uniref:NAD(P)H dehydrogenase (Quinone) n=1 Tax=Lysobacter enzymogenes TaxID=69 RepID=A0AAU9AQC5_LYSEN|nr:NAD(P)H-dependent oxidoreductase [Lysobacter enzymogenes]BAV97779.1 NAD(P)H dehydrogenase (quinone) [Lysobacter enzymogenes]